MGIRVAQVTPTVTHKNEKTHAIDQKLWNLWMFVLGWAHLQEIMPNEGDCCWLAEQNFIKLRINNNSNNCQCDHVYILFWNAEKN